MCNACGMMCCAYDGFSGCGCEHCDNPKCWSDDDGDDTLDLDGDDEVFFCHPIDVYKTL